METTNVSGDNIWEFYYKVGPAPNTGRVRASTEDKAYRTAVRWCELNNIRPPAKVKPFINADESILDEPAPAPKPQPIPDMIEATTGAMMERVAGSVR